ncbi:MAG: ABC transporter permease [Chloroflexi bacterium]|nr:ABC transporter permease [Chloroflexota bacterium]
MQRYLIRRFLQSLVTIFGVSVVIFLLTRIGGDPVDTMLPQDRITPQDIAFFREKFGLDKPLPVQYGYFAANALKGDLGRSYQWDRPVVELVVVRRFPATLQLAAATMLIAIAVGLPVGVLSALRPGGFMDRFGKLFAIMGQCVPHFWAGIMLILLFSVVLGLLPTSGRGPGLGHLEGWKYLLMPAFTLSSFSMAAVMRMTRSSMLDVLDSEYIKLLRLKGLPESLVVWKHALRNAAIPVVTLAALQVPILLHGSVVVETVFAWPGIGLLAVQAITKSDYPVVQAIVLYTAVLVVAINLAVDVLYAYLDPRIRYE